MRLISGDCIEAMRELPDESVDAIVTDPPYGLGFMGKAWDDLPPGEEWGGACLRVLKPGGHLLAFGGSRTYHRLACAVEDAGFEVRDQMMWLYGSGFPKSLDVSKAIDKAAGYWRGKAGRVASDNGSMAGPNYERTPKGEPVTAAAAAAAGWGTALKPAHEPIVVARKPLAGTVAENVLRFGTGALNIDGCRIEHDGTGQWGTINRGDSRSVYGSFGDEDGETPGSVRNPLGRWPANVILDEEAGRLLDEQSGERPSGSHRVSVANQGGGYGGYGRIRDFTNEASSGGASRFFYCAKASKGERNAGLDGFAEVAHRRYGKRGQGPLPQQTPNAEQRAANHHPTVKPISLMRYLVRLVTPPGGVILDPFLGSGTTGCASVLEGFDFIGIEREPEYLAIAEARIAWWEKHRGEGETDEILQAAGVRDEIEAGGQLDLLQDVA